MAILLKLVGKFDHLVELGECCTRLDDFSRFVNPFKDGVRLAADVDASARVENDGVELGAALPCDCLLYTSLQMPSGFPPVRIFSRRAMRTALESCGLSDYTPMVSDSDVVCQIIGERKN